MPSQLSQYSISLLDQCVEGPYNSMNFVLKNKYISLSILTVQLHLFLQIGPLSAPKAPNGTSQMLNLRLQRAFYNAIVTSVFYIHPSIFYTRLIQFRIGLEPIPAVIGREAGYTLDRSPVHHSLLYTVFCKCIFYTRYNVKHF